MFTDAQVFYYCQQFRSQQMIFINYKLIYDVKYLLTVNGVTDEKHFHKYL